MSPLYCWPRLGQVWERAAVVHYPHQEAAAVRIIEEMDGRGILADEVGLGKTIEAGLIMYELMYRGLANKVLVLVPAPLAEQWRRELTNKFGLEFAVNPRGAGWLDSDRIIASIDLAKREENRRLLAVRPFDLVIVDEAHKLKSERTLAHRFVRGLDCRYLVLLTATPLQNNMTELYNLASLVRRDLFGSYEEFAAEFTLDNRTPSNLRGLRDRLDQIMVRHRRRDVAPWFPRRGVQLCRVRLRGSEAAFYREITGTVKREYLARATGGGNVLPLITLQKEACSSPAAALETLATMGLAPPGDRRATTLPAKTRATLNILRRLDDQAVVFVEFRRTQDTVLNALSHRGIDAVALNGEMTQKRRQAALERFRAGARVLVSTECGGQGLNLQFCRNVINYDLPWNPMRLEQRIGRVHRLGQRREVNVYNLAAEDTIDEHVVAVLYEKVNLFSRTVGELETVIRQFDRRLGLERRMLDLYVRSETADAVRAGLGRLADELRGSAMTALDPVP